MKERDSATSNAVHLPDLIIELTLGRDLQLFLNVLDKPAQLLAVGVT
jgi:hypothetical protein